jgi:hypothetical protein
LITSAHLPYLGGPEQALRSEHQNLLRLSLRTRSTYDFDSRKFDLLSSLFLLSAQLPEEFTGKLMQSFRHNMSLGPDLRGRQLTKVSHTPRFARFLSECNGLDYNSCAGPSQDPRGFLVALRTDSKNNAVVVPK